MVGCPHQGANAMMGRLRDTSNEELQQQLDREMCAAISRNGFYKINLHVRDEIIKPMKSMLDSIVYNDIPVEHAAMEYYLMEESLKSLQTQKATNSDNADFFTEEHERTELVTFEHLALNAKNQAGMTKIVINLTVNALNELYSNCLKDGMEHGNE